MEMILSIVDRESVLLAVKSELAFGDTVGKTSRHLSAARSVVEIALWLVVSENYVSKLSVLVRNHD